MIDDDQREKGDVLTSCKYGGVASACFFHGDVL